MDFTQSPADLPNPSPYKSASGEKPRAGVFWNEVGQIKTIDGELKFPSLFRLMAALLTIPASKIMWIQNVGFLSSERSILISVPV